jgi:hypothetical protein
MSDFLDLSHHERRENRDWVAARLIMGGANLDWSRGGKGRGRASGRGFVGLPRHHDANNSDDRYGNNKCHSHNPSAVPVPTAMTSCRFCHVDGLESPARFGNKAFGGDFRSVRT